MKRLIDAENLKKQICASAFIHGAGAEKKAIALMELIDKQPTVFVNDKPTIQKTEVEEFIGQIIDEFEDFLAQKNVCITEPAEEDEAILTGDNYDKLKTRLEKMLMEWGILRL